MVTFKTNKAKAETIEQYELQISTNCDTISQYEQIKNQLHITAELIRNSENIDTEFVSGLSQKWNDYHNEQSILMSTNNEIQKEIDILKQKSEKINIPSSNDFIGYFEISHYDLCYDCTGKTPKDQNFGITATGTKATTNTIAVDPNVIPYGSRVIINGHTYIAEDTGSAIKGNKIDICVSSHSEALQKGKLYNIPVYIAS